MAARFSVKLYAYILISLCAQGSLDYDHADMFFLQLMSSNRYGESKAAYREVQERHRDIQKIERTLAELAQLFNDVSGRTKSYNSDPAYTQV